MRDATLLANILKAGSLPAPVKIVQNVTVGPTLGQDSIEAGVKGWRIALAVGAALVACVTYIPMAELSQRLFVAASSRACAQDPAVQQSVAAMSVSAATVTGCPRSTSR